MPPSSVPVPETEELCRRPDGDVGRQKRAARAAFLGTLACAALGLWLLLFGLFYWPADLLLPALGVQATGALLMVLGLAASLWTRDRARRTIVSVRITSRGVQAGVRGGSVLLAAWADPKFSLDLWTVSMGGPRAVALYGLSWRMPPSGGNAFLTPQGFVELVERAKSLGLATTERTYGKAPNVRTTFLLRGPSAEP